MSAAIKSVPGCNDIFEQPERLFNLDESGFPFSGDCGKQSKGIARRGTRHVGAAVPGPYTTQTIIACVNAKGTFVPPMMVIKGKTKRSAVAVGMHEFPEGWFTFTPSGWQTG